MQEAVESGSANVVKVLLKYGVDVNRGYPYLRSLLSYGYQDTYINHMIGLQGKTTHVCTALMMAAHRNQVSVMQVLLHAKANPEIPDDYGRTALMYAASSVQESTAARELSGVDLLIQSGANVKAVDQGGTSTIHYAAWDGRAVTLRRLLQADPTGINASYPLASKTALMHVAEKSGHIEALKILCGFYPKLEAADQGGKTALMYAARTGNKEAMLELLARGAKIKARNYWGSSVLSLAVFEGKVSELFISVLLSKGADMEAPSLLML